MRINFRLIVILLSITVFSYPQQQGYVITGDLTGFPDSTRIYLRNLSTDETFDSAIIIRNKFQFKGHLQDVPEQIWLNATVNNKFVYVNLLIGNEKIEVKGDIKDFPYNVSITGSRTQDDFNYLRDLTKSFDMERDSLLKSFFKLPPEIQEKKGKEIWSRIRSIDDTTHKLRIGYVKSHINTYPGIISLGYLKKSIPKDTVQALYHKLSNELKSSKYAKIVEIYLKEKVSEIGDSYHNFEAFNKTGEKVKFSSLTGKYVLLDITSAYCGPCIQSAEELRLIDKTFSDSLNIVSFSVDAKKDVWLNSLKRDSVTWVSLWDGKGAYSETYIKYGVQGLPTFFLIAPTGKMIDQWSGFGKGMLVEKLKRFRKN